MKISCFVLLAGLLSSAYLKATDHPSLVLDDIIECARDIIRLREGGGLGIQTAGRALEAARMHANSPRALEEISRRCFARREVFEERAEGESEEAYELSLYSYLKGASPQVGDVLRGFYEVSSECSRKSPEGFAFPLVLFCRNSLGEEWIERGERLPKKTQRFCDKEGVAERLGMRPRPVLLLRVPLVFRSYVNVNQGQGPEDVSRVAVPGMPVKIPLLENKEAIRSRLLQGRKIAPQP